MKQLLQFKTFLLLAVFSLLAGTQAWAQDSPFYTLDTTGNLQGTNNSYTGNCDVTSGDITWNVTGNVKINPWRLGGKSIKGVDRSVYTKTAMTKAVSKVVFTAGTATATVNSLELTVASDADFSNVIDNVTGTFAASSDITFTPTTGTAWANGAYYKLTFNVTVSGNSNKYVQFSKVAFYEGAEGPADERAAASITFNEDAVSVAIDQETYQQRPTLEGATANELTWTSSNEELATVDGNGLVTIAGNVGSVTITAAFAGNNDYKPATASYVLSIYDPDANDGSAERPFTVAEAIAKANEIGTTSDGKIYYTKGIISQIDSYNSTYKSIQYWISDDGTTGSQLECYSGKGIDGADFSSTDDLELGWTVVVAGNLKMFNTTPEYDKTNYIVSIDKNEDPSDTRAELIFSFPTASYELEAGAEAVSFTAPTLSITGVDGAPVELNEGDVVYMLDSNEGEGTLSVDPATGAVEIGRDYVGTFKVKASFRGDNNYKEASASYTVNVLKVLDIAGVRALEDNASGLLKFVDAKVLAVSGTQYIWVRDNSGALLLYNSGLSATVGQVINGKATVKKTTYRNQIETTGAIDDSELVITDGEDAVPVEINTADVPDYDSYLVKLSGVIVNNGVIEGDNDVTIFDGRFNLGYTFVEETQYDIVGIIGQYNTTVQIYPISVEEVADDTPAAPAISVPSGEVEAGTVVTVSYSDANATLIITTDDSNPADMEEGATVYDFDTNADLVADGTLTVSVTINEPTTIRAIVMNNVTEAVSDEATATYTIALPALDAPTFQPMNDISQYTIKGNNIYIGDEGQLQVYIIGSTTYDTYYTLDGSDPTTSETRKTITASTMNMRINMFHMAGFTVNVADGQTLKAVTYDATNSRYSEVADWGYIVHTGNPVVAAGTYAKVTSNADIEDGKNYILVFEDEDKAQVFTGELSTTSTKYGLNVEAEYSDENEINISELGVTPVVINALTEGFAIKVGDNYISYSSGNSLALSEDEYAWNIDVEATDALSSISSVAATDRFLQYNSSSPRFACYTSKQKPVAIYKEVPATETFENLTIDITSAGYSTLFYSDKDIELPVNGEGITVRAYTITFDGKKISEGDKYVSGDRIPANTAVVLEEYNHEAVSFVAKAYAPSAAAASESQIENYLYGFDVETDLEAEFGAEGYKYYKLSGSPSGVVGFYWAKADGAPFVSAAHKAVLILPADAAAGVRGFGLSDGNATAIQSVEVNAAANGKVYDLQGRRVQNAGKGVFIINGKKVIK